MDFPRQVAFVRRIRWPGPPVEGAFRAVVDEVKVMLTLASDRRWHFLRLPCVLRLSVGPRISYARSCVCRMIVRLLFIGGAFRAVDDEVKVMLTLCLGLPVTPLAVVFCRK